MPPPVLTSRESFARDHGVTPARWSGYNVSRFLRATGERPGRVAEARDLLNRLGLGWTPSWPDTGGVFDHGELWSRSGVPVMIVGHPYGIDARERGLLARLAREFPTLLVSVDGPANYYGYGTNHVRIQVAEVRRPFKPFPSTSKTRSAARAARKAFAEAFGDTST